MSYNGVPSRFTSFCLTNTDNHPTPPQASTEVNRDHENNATSLTTALYDLNASEPSPGPPPTVPTAPLTTSATAARSNMGHINIPPQLDLGMADALGLAHSQRARSGDAQTAQNCCCGRPSCAYWEHNNAALGGLERDLETAARLGQALLTRHESYIADSEAERKRLASLISQLSSENETLQSANESIVAENRELLAQLELLNTRLGNTDVTVKSLEATLADAQVELRKLNGLAARAEELERQLANMEVARGQAMEELELRIEGEKTALTRWREAQGKVQELRNEVERIEEEATNEKEKYAEILRRMEKEKMLGSAEGRLKGAAALASLTDPGGGGGCSNGVVSHFVRDILMDNANLQAGIAELKELLQASNEEVQNLREQILLHQPLSDGESASMAGQFPVSLEEQLVRSQAKSQPISQELHVHHHYHAKISAPRKDRVPVSMRRNGKKRPSDSLSSSTPDSSFPFKPTIPSQRYTSQSIQPCVPPIPQQTPRRERWSVQSSATAGSMLSSLPSSPRSHFDLISSGSIFDRIEQVEDTSRPTSPESIAEACDSPKNTNIALQKGRDFDSPVASFQKMSEVDARTEFLQSSFIEDPESAHHIDTGIELLKGPARHDMRNDTNEVFQTGAANASESSMFSNDLEVSSIPPHQQELETTPRLVPLQRSSSHDSLLSISGMDIHLFRCKPSQRRFMPLQPHADLLHPPLGGRTISTSQPLAAHLADVTASRSPRRPTGNSVDNEPPQSLSLAMLSGLAAIPEKPVRAATSTPSPAGLGRLMGGWVRNRWGVAPTKSPTVIRPHPTNPSTHTPTTAPLTAVRAPGINQKGMIVGLRPPLATPSHVDAPVLDVDGLRESLAELGG